MNKTDTILPVYSSLTEFDKVCKVCKHKIFEDHIKDFFGYHCERCSGSFGTSNYGILNPVLYGFPFILVLLSILIHPVFVIPLLPAIIGIPLAVVYIIIDVK